MPDALWWQLARYFCEQDIEEREREESKISPKFPPLFIKTGSVVFFYHATHVSEDNLVAYNSYC